MDYKKFLNDLQELQEGLCNKEKPKHDIKLGFRDLDKLIYALDGGSLVLLSARPAIGKTSLCISMSLALASNGKMVTFISYESKPEKIMKNLISNVSEIESEKIYTGKLTGEEYQKVVEGASRLKNMPLKIEILVDYLFSNLRKKLSTLQKGSIVFIDSLDHITLDGIEKNHWLEPEILAHAIKMAALEFNLILIATTTVSRKAEERSSHRPILTDLKYGYENCADIVMFLLRRDYYDPLDKPGVGELIVAKNRHGQTGNVDLTFKKDFGVWSNPEFYDLGYDQNLKTSSYETNDDQFGAFSR